VSDDTDEGSFGGEGVVEFRTRCRQRRPTGRAPQTMPLLAP
jgi:hypothetical protein